MRHLMENTIIYFGMNFIDFFSFLFYYYYYYFHLLVNHVLSNGDDVIERTTPVLKSRFVCESLKNSARRNEWYRYS